METKTMSIPQLQSILQLWEDKGMTTERTTALLASGILADVLDQNADLNNRCAVRVALKLSADMPEIFRIMIDYSLSLEAMIAAGHYDWTNSDIAGKQFPIEGEGVVEFEARYFNFDHSISSEDAVKEIESADPKSPWSAAKVEHLLSHGKTFPDEQRKFPIVGLGSVAEVDGDRRVPYLYEVGSQRSLNLSWWGGGWDLIYRFLAVRKVSVA